MKEARYFYVPDADVANELPEDEAQHALKVLRLAVGDEIFLIDGKGCFYRAQVTFTSNKHCIYEIQFDELSFLNCQFSERRKLRADRIEKIVVSAVKQSRKAWKPIVNDLIDFNAFVNQPRPGRKFIAHCYDEIERVDLFNRLYDHQSDEPITILVGPEGDFSIEEVRLAEKYGYISISLGNSRLRTETAGLAAVMMAHLAQRK